MTPKDIAERIQADGFNSLGSEALRALAEAYLALTVALSDSDLAEAVARCDAARTDLTRFAQEIARLRARVEELKANTVEDQQALDRPAPASLSPKAVYWFLGGGMMILCVWLWDSHIPGLLARLLISTAWLVWKQRR